MRQKLTFTHAFLIFAFLMLHLSSHAEDGKYRIESVFPGCDGDEKYFLLTFFLPYNPVIIAYSKDVKVQTTCNFWWPKNKFNDTSSSTENFCDLLWIDRKGDELDILHQAADNIKNVSAIVTTTHFFDQKNDFQNLKSFLERSGFTLLGHWYWENQNGEAIFIRSDIFQATMRALNYTSSNFVASSSASKNNIERYFKKAGRPHPENKMDKIDLIYMINLDERPEKFATATIELALYGIYPHRFSAVNGWNLPTSVLNEIGVKFTSDLVEEKLMGSIYREIDGKEYFGHELIRANGETFFLPGMSRGSIGIVLSHLSVLQDAYDSGYQTIWVMEDDIEAVDDPRKISECISKLDLLVGDWDILFTDRDTKDREGNYVPCRALAARPNFKLEPLSHYFQNFYPINQEFSRIGMRYGAYSMIIRRSGMEKILKHFKTYGVFLPYDMDLWLNSNVKMYAVNKDIVSHRAGSPTDNNKPHYLKKEH